MKKKIIWRLANRPTPQEVINLNDSGLLSKEEAREILLSEETEEKVSEDSLKSEIKFLREIVERLSKGNQSTVIETIRYIEKPYHNYGWYKPYAMWCSGPTGVSNQLIGTGTTNASNALNTMYTAPANGGSLLASAQGSTSFSAISTF
jgi:hypothetical protein